ncbi:DUF3987 domain-containing protein [Parabacteroides sp. An277]|uniref:DUF3987 domain-containing protein n=1 Tax=Parabacteroides sp. An277 TaxID=1965619 RepID=UPI001EF6CFB9|nr:DUF3987 domain-containing protein [Parabacteroides sp. An277]
MLPIDGLSTQAQGVIDAIVGTFQCSRDMVVASLFAVAGTAVGKRLVIDDGKYQNYPCLWICNIAPSGSNKSTPMRFLLQPLKDRDAYNYGIYREKLKLYKAAGDDKAEKPVFNQFLVSDSTPEARNQVLSVNPNGVLLYRDELKGMIDDFGRYNRSGELSQLLSIYDSDNIIVNRKSDDTLLIEKPFMSILGSIQPSVLNETFGNELMMGNGFVQRWLFCFPDSVPPAMYSDEVIPSSVANDWRSFIYNLLMFDFSAEGGKLYLRSEAKKVYIEYYNKLQLKKVDTDDYMAAVCSKLQIYVIRWAGIAHILGRNPYSVDISPEEMEYSCRCMDYFIGCAEKVYQILRSGKNRPEAKPMGNEEMVARLYFTNKPKNQRAFADALGVSQPYIAKCLKKYSRLSGYRLSSNESVDIEEDNK